jgi:hypothetical protein
VLVLDDLNGIAAEREFADWLKSTIDKMALTEQRLPVCMVLVGVEERRHQLIQNMPSLARAFDLYELQPWSFDDAKGFYRDSFSSVGVHVDDPALDTLARYSGGLPMLAHEIGDATFNLITANHVDGQIALQGLVNAADVIGKKHIRPQALSAINSKAYRSTLMKLANDGSAFTLDFSRARLCELLDDNERRKVDNFLRRMQEIGIVEPGASLGEYRFVTHLTRMFLWLEAQRGVAPQPLP